MAKRTLNLKSTLIPTSIQGAPSRVADRVKHRFAYEVTIKVREGVWDNKKHIVYNFYKAADKFLNNDRYSSAGLRDGVRKHTQFKPYIDQTVVVWAQFSSLTDMDDFMKELQKDADTE